MVAGALVTVRVVNGYRPVKRSSILTPSVIITFIELIIVVMAMVAVIVILILGCVNILGLMLFGTKLTADVPSKGHVLVQLMASVKGPQFALLAERSIAANSATLRIFNNVGLLVDLAFTFTGVPGKENMGRVTRASAGGAKAILMAASAMAMAMAISRPPGQRIRGWPLVLTLHSCLNQSVVRRGDVNI